jgi:hypothetical protein
MDTGGLFCAETKERGTKTTQRKRTENCEPSSASAKRNEDKAEKEN